ncbi:1-deoxy-D-xylulose-5-phosphate synthase [Amantichitinum ursilacus]|uniref:1-deoxy-D-xylulose-5-phosphate synthase n=1 Tax=Amantichitinum ursilacus TaxID=857265 RepID=A0A0N0XMT2_9NEIS|nr:1-deoxy-D-xylulose-5-phosphate synthase [Amantichitinum ursilacus]KPC54498.1 1-deoxy-D-xylulose-5-phosphate synthase [Amantichitinum ursilacus]
MTSLLDQINLPADLRRLNKDDLPQVASELRQYLLDSISSTGGHFASNLGAVELTVALHYVFDTPHDRLVWDVGHQSYPHKILTGRKERMNTMRKQHGLAGFPKREESEYDTFGVGHSSTSIGAALGFAEAAKLKGEQRKSIAVIGDGSMTAGMAFEALNNAGERDVDLLVILNDNEMSISPNVGALNSYLARLLSGKFYNGFRNVSDRVLTAVPPLRELAKRSEEHVKGLLTPGTLFEEFGFNYIGPIDGHDIDTLVATLSNIKKLSGPQFLHVVTKKGQGYKLAVADPVKYHAVSPFTPENGMPVAKAASKPTYTQIFGDWLCDMAAQDDRLVGVTPAMREGSGLVRFAEEHPTRYFDVGIAEQHAVTFAAGLACEGMKPVVAIYSTFLQRAYDQLIHDVALQNLPVVFAIDRAGLVGADGPTHAGAYDLSFMRCIPNLAILAPGDENECRQMLYTAYKHDGPSAVRYPRGSGNGTPIETTMTALPWGKSDTRRVGKNVAILSFGARLPAALQAGEALDATVVNMRFIKPLDEARLLELAATHDLLVTVEDNAIMGGAGSAVLEVLSAHQLTTQTLLLGLPDAYVEHGEQGQLLADCGLDGAGIEAAIKARLGA